MRTFRERVQWSVVLPACLSLALASAACRAERPLPQRRFDLQGKVVGVDRGAGTVTVAHEAIPGYMPAMTMAYPLKDQWAFDVLKPGQTVTATLVVTSARSWLEGIVITEAPTPEDASLAPPESTRPLVGVEVPDFPLVNQDGKRIHLHQFRGQALLLTFIYTRCPLPDYCPLMSRNFAKILAQAEGDPALSHFTHLLSISIDPQYDKPAVLRAYALDCAGTPHPFDHWDFASGTPQQVRKVAEFFGLQYWTEGGQIVHALVTALVGPDGKVAKVYRGNGWQPADILGDIRSLPRR